MSIEKKVHINRCNDCNGCDLSMRIDRVIDEAIELIPDIEPDDLHSCNVMVDCSGKESLDTPKGFLAMMGMVPGAPMLPPQYIANCKTSFRLLFRDSEQTLIATAEKLYGELFELALKNTLQTGESSL